MKRTVLVGEGRIGMKCPACAFENREGANYTSISEKLDPLEVHHIVDGCFRVTLIEPDKVRQEPAELPH